MERTRGPGGEVLAPGGVDGAADRSACAGAGAGRAARAASTPPPRLPPRARWSPGTAEANRAGPNPCPEHTGYPGVESQRAE